MKWIRGDFIGRLNRNRNFKKKQKHLCSEDIEYIKRRGFN